MMQYTVTMTEALFSEIEQYMAGDSERAAYLLGKTSVTEHETRILIREFLEVERSEILSASPTAMSIASASFMRAMKRADRSKQVFFFVHSHPVGHSDFSMQDDEQEAKLMRTAYARIDGPGPHGTMVFVRGSRLIARFWTPQGM